MWSYQKPGFEALLLAELQRQQQCSQFCDTLLKTEGVSVPAHGCILSAISPQMSSALSSTPPPPAGQSRLLEFRALGACSLLHMVRLLYCGEMVGEGEKEKQEAISAAAKLGIHGLVEVTKRDCKCRNKEEWRTEVGVQTEPLRPQEKEERLGRWRSKEMTDGSTVLWKETLLDGKDTWPQTEQLQVNSGPPPQPAASFETIDMTALHGLEQTDSHPLPPQIPSIPISLVYPPDENTIRQASSALADSMHESAAAGHTVVAPSHTFVPPPLLPFSSHVTPGPADLENWWDVTAVEELGDEQLEQFQGNIPEYISYFLNLDKEKGVGRGRARRRQGAGVGGARRGGTAERRARTPQERRGGRGRRGLTQTVDLQDVGVSKLQTFFLQRWGPSRTGQGGGSVGRKLYLKTRELLKSTKSGQRRRRRGKVWEFSQSGDVLPDCKGGGGGGGRGRGNTQHKRNAEQQFNLEGLPVGGAPRARGRPPRGGAQRARGRPPRGGAQRARGKPTAPDSSSSPHIVQTVSALSPSLSPPPSLLSPAASYVPPESSLLLSTSLPPPPHEQQPEHFDRLLEEVMMGLNILPNNNNNNNRASHSQPPPPTGSSSYASCDETLVQTEPCDRTAVLLEASPGSHGSTQAGAKARGDVGSDSERPVLQQQCEGELDEMLDHFLQSFEWHVDSCTARKEAELGGQSGTEASQPGLVKSRRNETNRRSRITELHQSDEAEKPRKTSAPENTKEAPMKVKAPAKQRKRRRRKNESLFSLEKERARKPVSPSDKKTKDAREVQGDEQLQQRPVVELERCGRWPVEVTPQERSCLEDKSRAKAPTSSSSVKYERDSLVTKTHPVRSRVTGARFTDGSPSLQEPLLTGRPPAEGRPHRSGNEPNDDVLSPSRAETSAPPIQPPPVELCGTVGQRGKRQKRHEEENTVKPQEEGERAPKEGGERRAESEEVPSDVSSAAKRVCFETRVPSSRSADAVSEPATGEMKAVSLASERDRLQIEDGEKKTMWIELKLRPTEECLLAEETEVVGVDGDPEDDRCPSRTEPTRSQPADGTPPGSEEEVCVRSTGSWEEDEDIDVIGGFGPAPEPVIISWTESSEEEGDEDIDVVGEKTDYATGRRYKTEGL
ncbi:uncharacterized protein LOC130209198 isoform X2 [Pseudoliparis swirei]|nr:uncharacterized protein LOC130209198 isoform X2 [Pseudoliparis swirei]XP_056294674.1 uncharacterized protein LOC130209198 isoform X2 [Pseudoliparis swirei]